jgi:hypothetical protein
MFEGNSGNDGIDGGNIENKMIHTPSNNQEKINWARSAFNVASAIVVGAIVGKNLGPTTGLLSTATYLELLHQTQLGDRSYGIAKYVYDRVSKLLDDLGSKVPEAIKHLPTDTPGNGKGQPPSPA